MVRWYIGMPDQALAAFQADAAEAIQHGFSPISTAWTGDRLIVTYARPAERGLNVSRVIGGGIGGALLILAGLFMLTLQSVAGDTVAEAFDHAVGFVAFGLAAACLGWAFSD